MNQDINPSCVMQSVIIIIKKQKVTVHIGLLAMQLLNGIILYLNINPVMPRGLVLTGNCMGSWGPADFLMMHSEVVSLETRFGYQHLPTSSQSAGFHRCCSIPP